MEKKWILLLDPELKQLYRYNLNTHSIKYEKEYTERATESIDSEIKILDHLRGFELSGWTFKSNECENFRRRAVWEYMIEPPAEDYPAYATCRELSSAFASVTYIKLIVDISRYLDESNISPPESEEDFKSSKQSFQLMRNEKLFSFKVSLVSTANEAIKAMVKQIYKTYRIKIRPLNANNQLTLKVRGRKDYFTGNSPMLAYRQIRASLRGMEYLAVNLTEIPKKIFFQSSPFVSEFDPLTNLYNFYIFYAPYSSESVPEQPRLMKPRVFFLNNSSVSKTREELTDKLLNGKLNSLSFSGECEWPFRVRVCGVENLYNIFAEGYRGNATNNGTEKPEYVVKPKVKEKSREENHNTRKSSGASEKRSIVPAFKTKQFKAVASKLIDQNSSRSAYMNHGPSSSSAQELANEFKLPFAPCLLSFDVMILYGDSVLRDCYKRTEYCPFNYSARIMEWVDFPIKISEVPKEARLGINLYSVAQNGENFLIGSFTKTIFDEKGKLRSGLLGLNLWPFYRIEERLGCMQEFWGTTSDYLTENFKEKNENDVHSKYARIFVQFESFYNEEVTWSLKDYSYLKNMYKRLAKPYRNSSILIKSKSQLASNHISITGSLGDDPYEEEDTKSLKTRPQIEELACLEKILLTDPLEELSKEEKRILFICRDHYKSLPLALPLFLKSIDWTRPLQVSEAHKFLNIWSAMEPEDAMALLNADYADENVRLYATRRISQLSDDDFALYMPQLIQALSFESSHFSSLGEMLLQRALKNPHHIGHVFFWALRSQLHVKATSERFGLLLEQFVMLCGSYRHELLKELTIVELYSELGEKLATKDSFQEREKYLRVMIDENKERAQKISTIPVDSSMEVSGPRTDKCKVMDSKKMPLWLTMINSETSAGYIPVIFKVGDDLRQDILTLQMIRVMDTIWLENGLDLRMKPYQVVATGDQSGIIEVVMNSETTAEIQKQYGGTLGALKKNTLKDFLVEHNPGDEQYEKALDNFTRSCAGYCVATYILGIADRHNGNIMMTKTGHLFHIDFGHFLGNFKTKLGIQRERSKFVFTEEMVYVMGGKDSEGFNVFKDFCCKAYNYIRKHGKRLINLFMLMITAGMPELKNKEEIKYLREMLSLKLTEMEADIKFNAEIQNALNNTFRRIDNFIHNLKH
jgi:phosphatidylinositol-4,5-bisphosphate 3-kinase catalytic subunit alpha/beta/delta